MGTIQQWINNSFAAIKSAYTVNSIGEQAERVACQYLCQQGLQLVRRNYRTKAGEIDLIMRDKNDWVFVEVKFRTNQGWASAAESVTRDKQLKVINAAKQFLQQYKIYDLVACRFDVITIETSLNNEKIDWIPGAFN